MTNRAAAESEGGKGDTGGERGSKSAGRRTPLGLPTSASLLERAPDILRSLGCEPAPKPYRPRYWRSDVWLAIRRTIDGGVEAVVALPVSSLALDELERRIGKMAHWNIPVGRGRSKVPDTVLLLVPEDEPVQLRAERIGVKPALEVVRIHGVPPRPRMKPIPPFRHRTIIEIFYPPTREDEP